MGIQDFFRPIFARGQDSLVNPSSTTESDGSTVFNVSPSAGQYIVGDHIFVSKADDSVPQYLGQMTAKNGNLITTPLALSRGYTNASVKIWRPTKFWRPAWGTNASPTKRKESGVSTRMSIGGQPNATQVADPSESATFNFSPTLPADIANWETFLFTDMLNGLNSFAMAWWDPMLDRTRLVQVKKRMGDDTWVSTLRGIHVGFSATFLIETEDTYPTPL